MELQAIPRTDVLLLLLPIIADPTNQSIYTASLSPKRHKLNTSEALHNCQIAPHPRLFNPHLHESHQPTKNVPKDTRHHQVTTYDEVAGDLQQFFTGQFPDHQSDSIIYKMEFDGFSWAVWQYGKSGADMPNTKELATNVLQKAMALHHCRGHFYYFSMQIVPIY